MEVLLFLNGLVFAIMLGCHTYYSVRAEVKFTKWIQARISHIFLSISGCIFTVTYILYVVKIK